VSTAAATMSATATTVLRKRRGNQTRRDQSGEKSYF
jgi:hypothetical protein